MTQTLTLEEIGARLGENDTRLEVISGELEKKNAELGSARGWRLSTVLIHRETDKLEHERRELEAEQKFLEQERQNIQSAIAQKAAEVAAVEYKELLQQLTPRAVEIIQSFCALQNLLLELEKIQTLMSENAFVAGKLADPIPYDSTIIIQVDLIKADVSRALAQIVSFNGQENMDKAGVHIPDMYAESDKTLGRFNGDRLGAERATVEPSPSPVGLNEAARRGARLTE